MNRCVISGLLSVGINVEDLRSYPAAALALSRRAPAGDGGVHVAHLAATIRIAFLVEFFDRSGINVDKNDRAQDREPLLPRRFPPHRRWTTSGCSISRRARSKRYTSAFLDGARAQAHGSRSACAS